VDILIVPTVVQGAAAAEQIVRAIEQTKRLVPLPDALLVTRGGGSLEDLWCFNDERVVRAIHASPMPVVSAVGHEIDVTLADLVADRRALTPSEAGELLIPASDDLQNSLSVLERRMRSQLRARFSGAQARLEMIARRRLFQDPYLLLRDAERRLDELLARGEKAVRRSRDSAGQQLAAAAAQLHSLSPLAVLERGYSVTQTATGELATVNSVSLGQLLRTRVRDGEIASRVEGIRPSEPLG
jgi:exodeoxyribonuclease VII large subunit